MSNCIKNKIKYIFITYIQYKYVDIILINMIKVYNLVSYGRQSKRLITLTCYYINIKYRIEASCSAGAQSVTVNVTSWRFDYRLR